MKRKRLATAMAVMAVAIVVAACGSTNSSSPSSSCNASASSAGSSSVGPNTVVVKGIPTLAELYKGTESAPPSSSPPPAKNKTVWWISCGQSVPDCAARAAAAQQAGKLLGWTVRIADSNVGASNGYVTAVQTALASHPSAIIQDATGCNTNSSALEEAKQEGVPVEGAEATDCPKPLFALSMEYDKQVPNVTDYWLEWGKISADYVIDETDGKAQLINNMGTGDSEFTLLNQGFMSEFKKCSGCKVLTNVGWTVQDLVPNGAWISALRTALTRYSNANVVYMPFSFMESSLGGAQAIKESGVKAIGIGGSGDSDSLALIDQGLWNADSSAYSLPWIGYGAIDELNRYFNHKPSVPEGVGFVVVNKQHGLPASQSSDYTTPINFEAAYKKIWGVK